MDEASNSLGYVTSVGGAQVSVALSGFRAQDSHGGNGADSEFEDGNAVRIGELVKLRTPVSTIFGVVTKLGTEIEPGPSGPLERNIAEVDLMGEVLDASVEAGRIHFERGVSIMPTLGLPLTTAESSDVGMVYAQPETANVQVGAIHQDQVTPAFIMVNDLLAKHFAILGTTGSGKSCSVALILRKILTSHPAGHVVLLDPHNEYRGAFEDLAEVIEPQNLSLPCWLLTIEEIASVMVRAGDEAEQQSQVNILKDSILEAKKRYASKDTDTTYFTPDTPVPYRLTELIRIINDNMGKLDKADTTAPFLRLLGRLEQLNADKRFSFMFSGLLVRDSMPAVLSRFLRIPVEGRPLTIVDLSGVPSEIVDVVVSVISRLVFDFAVWSDRARTPPLLLVCEEAHRYIPEDDKAQSFTPTKLALSRIAKEGRKYGVSLCLVSQRPSELSASVISQCGTLFALRMNNTKDQDFVAAAMPENGLGLLAVLPALRRQEAVVVGEGVTVPMRLRFDTLSSTELPRSGDAPFAEAWAEERVPPEFIIETIDRWRRQQR